MSKLIKKLKKISKLLKAAIMPSLRPPGAQPPKPPKMPSIASKNKKNPINVAKQIKDPNIKNFAMDAAKNQVKANTNQVAASIKKSEGDSYKYHIIKDSKRLTTDPVSVEEINRNHGGVEELKASGHDLVPVKYEELSYDRGTGQWSLRPKK